MSPPLLDLRPYGPPPGYRTRVTVSFVVRGMWCRWIEAASVVVRREEHRQRAVLRVPLFVDGVRVRDISGHWCWALSVPIVAPSLAYLSADGGVSITASLDGDAEAEDVHIPPPGWRPTPVDAAAGRARYPHMPRASTEGEAAEAAKTWAWARGRRVEIHTSRPEPGGPA